MVSHYIAHCVRTLNGSGIISPSELAKILGVDQDKYSRILASEDGSQINIAEVDRFVEFFGIACLQGNFIRSVFGSESSTYKTWEDLDKEQQKAVNLGSVYVASQRSCINSLSYVKECEYFLDSCSTLVSIVKDAAEESAAEEDSK